MSQRVCADEQKPRLHLPGRAVHLVKSEEGRCWYISVCYLLTLLLINKFSSSSNGFWSVQFCIFFQPTATCYPGYHHLKSFLFHSLLFMRLHTSDSFFCLTRSAYNPQHAPTSDFLELMVSPSMAWDHFPDRYLTEITRLWESWSWWLWWWCWW